MFDETNIPKKTNLGILRGLEIDRKKENYIVEEIRRRKLIEEIQEGKFQK